MRPGNQHNPGRRKKHETSIPYNTQVKCRIFQVFFSAEKSGASKRRRMVPGAHENPADEGCGRDEVFKPHEPPRCPVVERIPMKWCSRQYCEVGDVAQAVAGGSAAY